MFTRGRYSLGTDMGVRWKMCHRQPRSGSLGQEKLPIVVQVCPGAPQDRGGSSPETNRCERHEHPRQICAIGARNVLPRAGDKTVERLVRPVRIGFEQRDQRRRAAKCPRCDQRRQGETGAYSRTDSQNSPASADKYKRHCQADWD